MMKNVKFTVGIFFIIGISSLLFLSLNVSNLIGSNIDSEYELVAFFDDVGGLKPRAAVRSSGVLVGRVKTIDFDSKKFQAKVVIDMQKGVRFPNDSSATILTAGLLGEKYIGISLIKMNEGIDEGLILKEKSFLLKKQDDIHTVHNKVNKLFPNLLTSLLKEVFNKK